MNDDGGTEESKWAPDNQTPFERKLAGMDAKWAAEVSDHKLFSERLVYYWKTTGTPSHYKNVLVKIMHILKNEKYVSRSY